MIVIFCNISKTEAEQVFAIRRTDGDFDHVVTELLTDLTEQISDFIAEAQKEVEEKLQNAQMRRHFIEAIVKISTWGASHLDLVEEMKKVALAFQTVISFNDDSILYKMTAFNMGDMYDYRRLNTQQMQEIEKSLSWPMRQAIRMQGGIRAFFENIFKGQDIIAREIVKELREQFPTASIKSAVNRKPEEA